MRQKNKVLLILFPCLLMLVTLFNNCSAPKAERKQSASVGTSEMSLALQSDFSDPADSFSFHDFLKLIDNKKLKSIESVLANLPGEFRKNFTLVHTSRSLQESSVQNPRAIIFGQDAGFIMTFNGDKSHRGYDNIEMMHWNNDQKEFELRELQFDPENQKMPVLSGPNPLKCMQCHSAAPKPSGYVKPIISDYPVWRGFYGSQDDSLFRLEDYNQATNSLSREDILIARQEHDDYMKFMDTNAFSHPRYKFLYQHSDGTETYPYKLNTNGDYLLISFDNAPNTRLTDLLYTRQLEQLTHRITNSKLFAHLKNTIGASLMCGASLPSDIEQDVVAAINSTNSLNEIKSKIGEFSFQPTYEFNAFEILDYFNIVSRDEWDLHMGIIREESLFSGYNVPVPKSRAGIYVTSKLAGVLLDSNERAACSNYIDDFTLNDQNDEPKDDYLAYVRDRWPSVSCPMACDSLKIKSKTELQQFKQTIASQPDSLKNLRVQMSRSDELNLPLPLGVPEVINKCIGCHTEQNVQNQIAPYIPFLNQAEIKVYRSRIIQLISSEEPELRHGGMRMPFGQPTLTVEESEKLIEYIR